MSLFRLQPAARQEASQLLLAHLGVKEQVAQDPCTRLISEDPLHKLLDGGVGAQVTAACASHISASFRYVH